MSKDFNLIYNQLFLKRNFPSRVSVFISGTDHIGTSWCALTLSHALNIEKQRVLLVDGNGNLSNISSYIMLSNPLYLEEYVTNKKTLNQLITAYKNKDFNILAAAPGHNYLETQPIGRIHIFLEDLAILIKDYQHTLIDVGATINEQNLGLCQMADNIYIVCSEKSNDLVKTLDIIRFLQKYSHI